MDDNQYDALITASNRLLGQTEEESVLQSILEDAAGIVDAESCAVILLDKDTDECYFYSATGPDQSALRELRFQKDLGIAGKVLDDGKAVLVANTDSAPDHFRGVDQRTGVETRSLLCVPMSDGKETVGVLEAINKTSDDTFMDSDLKLLSIFANFASLALGSARTITKANSKAVLIERDTQQRTDTFICKSKSMLDVWKKVDKVAGTDATVLLRGESGTGKEVVATLLHRKSKRSAGPCTAVNCAALHNELLSSELFGHEKGAFTGASDRKKGRFELAKGGTIFLDEIGDADPSFQTRLLRVLETKTFERLGGTEEIRTDARIIAATNVDLHEAVAKGTFREDLFYRLNVVSIQIPPLRERRDDIRGLFDFFAARFAAELGYDPIRLSAEAAKTLVERAWRGNVRELKNFVERATIMATESVVENSDIDELATRAEGYDLQGAMAARNAEVAGSLWDQEKASIERALEATGWNQSKAARDLGISRHHLRYRIQKYKISRA